MSKLFVFGSINIDLAMRVDYFPAAGETVMSSSPIENHGGKGANLAVMAARHGVEVNFIGAVGDDDYGRRALENLTAEGISIEGTEVLENEVTGLAVILLDKSAENRIIVAPGANRALRSDRVLEAVGTVSSGDIFVSQFETPQHLVEDAIIRTKSRGATTVLNPSPFRMPSIEALQSLDYLVCNQIEFSQISEHISPSQLFSIVPHVIVTKGSDGIEVYERANVPTKFPVRQLKAIDTTGAGDGFLGSFCASLLQLLSLNDSIKVASFMASESVLKAGAQSSYPGSQDLGGLRRQALASNN